MPVKSTGIVRASDNIDYFEDTSYNGNEDHKRGVVKVNVNVNDFTYFAQEIMRCRNDIQYFADNYFTILDGTTGHKGIINMYDKQKEMLELVDTHDRVICAVGRQSGKSTVYTIDIVHKLCFFEDKMLGIMAQNAAVACDILDRVKMAIAYLPKWMKPGIKKMSGNKLVVSTGGECIARPATLAGVRGLRCQYLYVDELAFIARKHENEIWKTVYPVVTSFTENKIIGVSTPNGIGNLFHKFYSSGMTNQARVPHRWTSYTYNWTDVPGRDEEWRQNTIATMCEGDEEAFEQEFECSFLGGGTSLLGLKFIDRKIAELDARIANGKIDYDRYIEIAGNRIHQYFDPLPNRCYVLSSDIGEGSGNDSTVIDVIDITNPMMPMQVAHIADPNFPLHTLAFTIVKLAVLYNCAVIMPENNGVGKGVCNDIKQIYEYPYIAKIGSKMPGICSSNSIKNEACSFFRMIMETIKIELILHTKTFYDEMCSFQRQDLNTGHTYKCTGSHDDNVMSIIWAMYILKESNLNRFFDYSAKFVSLIEFPTQLKQFYSDAEIKQEQDYYNSILERNATSIGFTATDEINTLNNKEHDDIDYVFGFFSSN